ncbi:MAG: hypothetical protein D6769_01960 [Methanobacteriota archaeon]|nr:MAG: hypothetical protein D6769_01960 [Euryarchaeota archaeon]
MVKKLLLIRQAASDATGNIPPMAADSFKKRVRDITPLVEGPTKIFTHQAFKTTKCANIIKECLMEVGKISSDISYSSKLGEDCCDAESLNEFMNWVNDSLSIYNSVIAVAPGMMLPIAKRKLGDYGFSNEGASFQGSITKPGDYIIYIYRGRPL